MLFPILVEGVGWLILSPIANNVLRMFHEGLTMTSREAIAYRPFWACSKKRWASRSPSWPTTRTSGRAWDSTRSTWSGGHADRAGVPIRLATEELATVKHVGDLLDLMETKLAERLVQTREGQAGGDGTS